MELHSHFNLHPIQNSFLKKSWTGLFLRFNGFKYFDYALEKNLREDLHEKIFLSFTSFLNVKRFYYLGQGDFYYVLSVKNCSDQLDQQLQLVLNSLSSELLYTSFWCVLYHEHGLNISIDRQILASKLNIDRNIAMPLRINNINLSVLVDFDLSFNCILNFPKAISLNEIVFDYQPIYDIQMGQIKSLEALARWRTDDHEIKPDDFIPAIQSSHYARAFDLHLIRTVSQNAQDLKAHYGDISISINLSGEAIADKNFIDLMLLEFAKHNIELSSFIIEISELTPVNYEDRYWHNIIALKKTGIRLALDDFGQGYSCFSNLRNLPIDILKIDKELTASIIKNSADLKLMRMILEYCSQHNKNVIIEGVETIEQHAILKKIGAKFVQGFFYERPQKIDSLLISSKFDYG